MHVSPLGSYWMKICSNTATAGKRWVDSVMYHESESDLLPLMIWFVLNRLWRRICLKIFPLAINKKNGYMKYAYHWQYWLGCVCCWQCCVQNCLPVFYFQFGDFCLYLVMVSKDFKSIICPKVFLLLKEQKVKKVMSVFVTLGGVHTTDSEIIGYHLQRTQQNQMSSL